VELNSALAYQNYSCGLSLEIDTDLVKVSAAKEMDLQLGDELNFFYLSTELLPSDGKWHAVLRATEPLA